LDLIAVYFLVTHQLISVSFPRHHLKIKFGNIVPNL